MSLASLFEEFAALESRLTSIENKLATIVETHNQIDDAIAQVAWSVDRITSQMEEH